MYSVNRKAERRSSCVNSEYKIEDKIKSERDIITKNVINRKRNENLKLQSRLGTDILVKHSLV